MPTQARRVQQCLAVAEVAGGDIILSGDDSDELKDIASLYTRILPPGWTIHRLVSVADDPSVEQPHKGRWQKEAETQSAERRRKAFRRIADMREAAHAKALTLNVTHLWSLDSDVMPPANALRTSFDVLRLDGGFYGIAFCTYPNLEWLGGLGAPGSPMAENYLPHERALPEWLRGMLDRVELRMKLAPTPRTARLRERVHAYCRRFEPDGNVFQVNGKYGWRPRGWVNHAYPGLGLGVIVPTTWCGFGCTLMGADALHRADFSSFQGVGTEDIHVIRTGWEPAGLRIALILHCPCDHVFYEHCDDGTEKRTYLRAYHEPAGECGGHLRYESIPL